MKRVSLIVVAFAAFVFLGALPAFAQRGGRGAGGGMGGVGGGMGGVGGGMGRGGDIGGPTVGGPRGDRSTIDHGATRANKVDGKKPLDQTLEQHPKLESKLASLLPNGTNMQQAASGFKNFGQFVAAVHVSHNLGIPFDQLKAKMTGQPPESLGKAIHDLKPEADPKAEAKKAEHQTHQDFEDSNDTDKN